MKTYVRTIITGDKFDGYNYDVEYCGLSEEIALKKPTSFSHYEISIRVEMWFNNQCLKQWQWMDSDWHLEYDHIADLKRRKEQAEQELKELEELTKSLEQLGE